MKMGSWVFLDCLGSARRLGGPGLMNSFGRIRWVFAGISVGICGPV
jgi:hypothetical protein